MSSKSVFDWFLTPNGRKFSDLFVGSMITGTLLSYIVPNTIFLDKYKDIIRLYSKGYSVPVPEKLRQRFIQTMRLLNIPGVEQLHITPFMACGFDIFSAGLPKSRFGIIVGLPTNFDYDNVETIDKSRIKVNQESVIWESEAGEKLLKSLVLSENAQMYAMAREIRLRQSAKLIFEGLFATIACMATYGICNSINIKRNLYKKPRSVRVVMYAAVTLFSLGNYFMFKDLSQIYYEEKIDKELKGKNPIFAVGGKEFYSQILERNIALRKLMGKEGESKYTALGNDNYLFRNKHLSLVHRKQFFEQSLKETS